MKLFNKKQKSIDVKPSNINSSDLYVGNLNSVYQSSKEEDDYQLMDKDGTVNYIFEKRGDEYYEIFTNKLIHTEESCNSGNFHCANIGELYLVNIRSIKDDVPNIKDKINRDCLLYLFDCIN
jgi:hypothetical protein